MSDIETMKPTVATSVQFIVSQGGTDRTDITFRPGRDTDAHAIYELSRPFVSQGSLVARDLDLFGAHAVDFHVVEAGGTIIACAGVRRFDDCAEIFNVAVDQRWQGRGIGRLLLACVLMVLRSEGLGRAFVFSKTATPWFARHGFNPVDPATLPAERQALIDPARNSAPLARATLRAADGVAGSAQLCDIPVRFAQSNVELPWTASADSLLSFAQQHGIETQSLCWGGICGTCSTPIKRGVVAYDVEPECDPPTGEVLLCLARPMTDLVLQL